jgi:hypothetical protein
MGFESPVYTSSGLVGELVKEEYRVRVERERVEDWESIRSGVGRLMREGSGNAKSGGGEAGSPSRGRRSRRPTFEGDGLPGGEVVESLKIQNDMLQSVSPSRSVAGGGGADSDKVTRIFFFFVFEC